MPFTLTPHFQIPKYNHRSNIVKNVNCGIHHTLLMTSDGGLYSFGRGSEGQLGYGKEKPRQQLVPRIVEGLLDVRITQVITTLSHASSLNRYYRYQAV